LAAHQHVQDLLGQKKQMVTQHYATVTIEWLFSYVDKLTDMTTRLPVLLRRVRSAAQRGKLLDETLKWWAVLDSNQ
jgi:hypothetical protein